MSSIGPVVSEEKMFENVDGRLMDGRMDGRQSHWYTISSPMSLQLRWAYNQDMLQSFALDNIHSHNVKINLKPLKTQVIQMLLIPIPGRSLICVHIIPIKNTDEIADDKSHDLEEWALAHLLSYNNETM